MIAKSSGGVTKSTSVSLRQAILRHRRKTISEAETLVAHLMHGKQRFVSLLAIHDPAGVGCMSMEELENVIQKMKPPISQECLKLMLRSLPEVERGRLDYRPLIKGDFIECVKRYLDSNDVIADCSTTNQGKSDEMLKAKTEAECETTQPICTLSGDRGTLSTAHKEEEKRQFEILLKFCQERGIVLNKELVERGTCIYFCLVY